MSYTVKTKVFQGPFDLLLELIQKRKLHISEVSLSEVTDDFLSHIKELKEAKLPGIVNFISVASTLILIKSKSLLPILQFTEEEESDVRNLEDRLRLYAAVQDVAKEIQEQFGKQIIFQREVNIPSEPIFTPDSKITLKNLEISIAGVLEALPKKEIEKPEILVSRVISLEEMIQSLTERIQKGIQFSFKSISTNESLINVREKKVYAIVSFLAMLELIRGGLIDAMQENTFEDISIIK